MRCPSASASVMPSLLFSISARKRRSLRRSSSMRACWGDATLTLARRGEELGEGLVEPGHERLLADESVGTRAPGFGSGFRRMKEGHRDDRRAAGQRFQAAQKIEPEIGRAS